METGGRKVIKTEKTKFRKNKDHENTNLVRRKHHDKTYYRLLKQEKDDYAV